MERPALQRLLADIAAGKIDVIVVYKIDRLTRALADFARMVELFDRHEVSFVSVTQAFNTTSSMGRLTLNVLLSFAQFEREVTGERIRDKIAASKAKGMWMGGILRSATTCRRGPSGPGDQRGEAETVRTIFAATSSSDRSARWSTGSPAGHCSKRRTTRGGRPIGGQPFNRGALFHMLRNRIYLGMIVHRDKLIPACIRRSSTPSSSRPCSASSTPTATARRAPGPRARAPLTGRIFDADGQPMPPTFAYGQSKEALPLLCISAAARRQRSRGQDTTIRRIPASALEAKLAGIASAAWRHPDAPIRWLADPGRRSRRA